MENPSPAPAASSFVPGIMARLRQRAGVVFGGFKTFGQKNKKIILVLAVMIIASGVVVGNRYRTEISRFFAYSDCDQEYDLDCDNDGYNGPDNVGNPGIDCDDNNPDIHPNAYDEPSNGIDENCDGVDASPASETTTPAPAGCVNPNPLTCDDGDCDDDGHQNPSVGGDDCNDAECSIGGGCPAASSDFDGDYYTPAQGDCDDFDINRNPGLSEIPGDGIDNDCNSATSDTSAAPTPTPASGVQTGQFSWYVTRNDYVQGCEDGPWFSGKILKFSGHADNPAGSGVTYGVTSGMYHDPQAGCTRTTYEPGGSLALSGKGTYRQGESGDFTLTVNPGADAQCGRYQIDSSFISDSAPNVPIMGVVLNYGVNCGPGSGTGNTPPPTATATATPPASSTPAPSPSATVPVLSCVSGATTANINEVITFSASGGTGTYAWSAPNGTPASGTAQSLNTQYAASGTKTVTVTSGSQTATCTVTINTPVSLVCSPSSVATTTNTAVTLSASGGTGTYAWSAPNGTPTSGSGASFGVVYATPSGSTPYQATVTSGSQTATCAVTVTAPSSTLACTPASQTVIVNQTANISASGGTGTYAWSAPNGTPTSGSGANFSVLYGSSGTQTVTLTSGSETRTCSVVVNVPAATTPPSTPPPTTPSLTIDKTVRNVTQNSGEANVVSANPGEIVEFAIRVVSTGNATVRNVRLSDSLPFGLSYLSGTTTIDGVGTGENPTSGGSIVLGDMTPGRTIVIRFRAQVAAESAFSFGTTTLTNTATAQSDNSPTVSDTAFVNVTRTQIINGGGNTYQLNIVKRGRNVTRGEFNEQSSVAASPNDTIEFIVSVRSLSTARVDNVIVKDIVPSGISYLPNTASVNGISKPDDLVSSQGLNIGSLDPNQQAIIRFSGRVNPADALPTGTTTVLNTAQASAPNIPTVIAQLPIVISNGTIAGISKVPTGAGESVLLALAISILVTMMYVTYTRTETFRRREIKSIIGEERSDKDLMNFKG